MVWLIVFIIGWVLVAVYLIIDKEAIANIAVTFIVAGFIVGLIPMCSGLTAYPNLVGKRACVISLKEEIKTIKDARYPILSSGQLIGGSLDNIKQSTVLSEYITRYARMKAGYNSELEKVKVRKQTFILILIADGFYIDKRVLELEKI